MKQALVVGATGFGGLGLIEILTRHPHIAIKQLVARRDAGRPISEVFPHLRGVCDLMVEPAEEMKTDGIDIAFLSTPDRVGMSVAGTLIDQGVAVIDFSGDFRFRSEHEYAAYARNRGLDERHTSPHLLKEAVYGLPEKNADSIRRARLVGNPGCFAICMILGILPAVSEGICAGDTIICAGTTGVSGAGKNSGEANLYPQRHENVNTYREGTHQHTVEVENILSQAAGRSLKVLFVPQIVPLNRGILIISYLDIVSGMDTPKVLDLYRRFYSASPFVMIVDRSPGTAEVRGSNRCLVRPFVDARTGKCIVVSVIDNLMKGQAGNAVQNANIILGFPETAGLEQTPFYP